MIKLTLLTTTKLIVGIIQQATVLQAIVVERNFHAYYKIPVFLLDAGHNPSATNKTQVYFILQCPYKATMEIPSPKDMQVCVTVGKYEEKLKPNFFNARVKPKTVLYTKVNYGFKQKPKRIVKRPLPFVVNIRPMKLQIKYKQPPLINNESNFKKKRTFLQGIVSESNIVPQQIEMMNENENSTEIVSANGLQNYTLEYYDDDDNDDYDERSGDVYSSESVEKHADDSSLSLTPLKFLNVRDAIAKFKNGNLKKYIHPVSDQSSDGALFFAEHTKYRKGHATKGYHNLYHRDENYKDHIFYDDLDQHGKIQLEGRVKQKYALD